MTTERSARPDDLPDERGTPAETPDREPVPGPRVLRPVVHLVRAVDRRTERLERAVERRWPLLYDLRHAASGIGRLVGPLIGAVFVLAILAILAPLLALLAALVALLGLFGLDLPDPPDVGVPGWLEAIGGALAAVGGWIGAVATVLTAPAIVLLVIAGVLRSGLAVRRRAAAERVGRDELLRRLAVTLAAVEAGRRTRGPANPGGAPVAGGERRTAPATGCGSGPGSDVAERRRTSIAPLRVDARGPRSTTPPAADTGHPTTTTPTAADTGHPTTTAPPASDTDHPTTTTPPATGTDHPTTTTSGRRPPRAR